MRKGFKEVTPLRVINKVLYVKSCLLYCTPVLGTFQPVVQRRHSFWPYYVLAGGSVDSTNDKV